MFLVITLKPGQCKGIINKPEMTGNLQEEILSACGNISHITENTLCVSVVSDQYLMDTRTTTVLTAS